MRILITGAGGQVGCELVRVFGTGGHEVAGFDHITLDITDRDSVRAAVVEFHPEAIVHSAAWTAVDACEADPERAFAVNGMGTRFLAEAARLVGAQVHYISTDYVFDGTKEGPYLEWDRTNPQSVYGASKLAGEHELHDGSSVIRTSWVCGFHGPNMVKTILRLAAENDTLSFVSDQRGCPTFADDLAAMIGRIVTERRSGVFHVTNAGAVSWYEFAREVLLASGQDPDRVLPVATVDLQPPRPAPRPANSVLENAALKLSGVPALDDFRIPLRRLVAELASEVR
ncbi:MAG: dTDP-4-dehydrorhamnose reductase [Actinomycetes bacterium]